MFDEGLRFQVSIRLDLGIISTFSDEQIAAQYSEPLPSPAVRKAIDEADEVL